MVISVIISLVAVIIVIGYLILDGTGTAEDEDNM